MSEIFLGKARHWLLFAVVAVCFFLTGIYHLHVSQFNIFVGITMAMAVLLVFSVILDYRPGDRVTREDLPEPDGD
ncbi:hypothetical protein [Nisaea nitritireducens]|uniref:hypothetical protein n=1 Tax=Nisaea nitritireducens TaxID=568392 RepID=UPI001865F31C|nr:hypothetical protein [Nisaea nitritireducens]